MSCLYWLTWDWILLVKYGYSVSILYNEIESDNYMIWNSFSHFRMFILSLSLSTYLHISACFRHCWTFFELDFQLYLDWWVWSLVMGFAYFNYWMHCFLLCISVIQSTFRFLLREANWSDHRPRFKATVNFNGKELLAASSVLVVKVYLNFIFYVYLKFLGLILLCFPVWVLSLWSTNFCIFSRWHWLLRKA